MKKYKYFGRLWSYKTHKVGWYYRHTFYDGDKEIFVYESEEHLDVEEVNKFIDRYILLMRKVKLKKIDKNL